MGLHLVPSDEQRSADALERIASALEEILQCLKHNQS